MAELNSTSKAGPREVFLQLLSIITLYSSASSLINLWFQYINHALNSNNFPSNLLSIEIRFHLATLIVCFPIYFFTLKKYREWSQQDPTLNTLRIKNWLTYLTLFLATLCIVIDLAILVYHFLGGDLSSSFIAKTLALFAVCGLIFYYYQNDLKNYWSSHSLRKLALSVWLIVLASIAYGFFVSGSPFQARQANFDTQRLTDLSGIQSQLVMYWNKNHQLPTNLDVLTNSISGYKAPLDPQTQSAYQYRVLSKNSFELCAQFNLSSSDKASSQNLYDFGQTQNANWNWQHPAGPYCFTRNMTN